MRNTRDHLEKSSALRHIVRFGVAMMLCVLIAGQATVAAQDDVPAEEQVAEPTPVPPTQPPAPTEIPPTPIPPTEIPAPTAIPATEAPVVTEPDPVATEAPTDPTATAIADTPVAIPPVVVCNQSTRAEKVAVGEPVEYRCSFTGGPLNLVLVTIPPGWEYSFDGKVDSYTDLLLTDSVAFDQESGDIRLFLRANEQAEPGEANFDLEFRGDDGALQSPTTAVTLIAHLKAIPDPTVDDLDLTCNVDSLLVEVGATAAVECSISSTIDTPVTVSSISIPALSGWSVTSGLDNSQSGVLTVYPSALVASNAPVLFSFNLAPSCAANPAGTILELTSTFEFEGVQNDGPMRSLTISRSDEASISTSITESSLGLATQFSFQPQQVESSLTYHVTATGCAGWSVQISATDYIYSGPVPGGWDIPSSNISLVSNTVSALQGQGVGLHSPQSGVLGGSLQVLAAGTGDGPGSYEQTLNFTTTIPGHAPVGSYTSVLTIYATAAP